MLIVVIELVLLVFLFGAWRVAIQAVGHAQKVAAAVEEIRKLIPNVRAAAHSVLAERELENAAAVLSHEIAEHAARLANE